MVDAGLLTLATRLVLGVALIVAAVLFIQRPKLRASLSLRGGTRRGVLYVLVENPGRTTARDVRLRVVWRRGTEEALIEEAALGELSPVEPLSVQVRDLQAPIAADPLGWTRLEVTLTGRRVRPVTVALDIEAKPQEAPPEGPREPVSYVREAAARCPLAPDGKHVFELRRFPNDGVNEEWEICRRCGFVHRLPLSPEDEERQRRVRAERAERERRRLEEEWARQAAQEAPRPRPGRPVPPRWAPPPDPGETLPIEVAFWILGLDGRTATWEDVQAAHRRLALQHHPDKAAGMDERSRALAEERMQDVNRARDRLREHFHPREE